MFSDLKKVSIQSLGCLSREPVQSLLAKGNTSITWDSKSKAKQQNPQQQQQNPWSHEAPKLVSQNLFCALCVQLPLALFHSAVHPYCVPAFMCNCVFLRSTSLENLFQPGRQRVSSSPSSPFHFPCQSFCFSPSSAQWFSRRELCNSWRGSRAMEVFVWE